MRLDMHTHSSYSPDSRLDPVMIVKRARELSLDGVAITDHNATEGAKRAIDYARQFRDFVVIRAVEVSTAEGHVLGYGVTEEIPRGLGAKETVERIVAQGGVAVAAHPYRFWSGLGERATVEAEFAVYEVLNARTLGRGNRKASRLAVANSTGRTGGSDGHFIDEIGVAVTVLEERLEKEDDILQALYRKRTSVEGKSRGARATMRYVPKCVGEWMTRGFRRI